MPDLQNLLNQIDRLDQEATPGPWYQGQEKMYESPVDVFATRDPEGPGAQDIATYMHSENDAEFIALARTALPTLAKAVRAVLELDKTRTHDEDPTSPFCNICGNVYGPQPMCETYKAITDAMEGDDEQI